MLEIAAVLLAGYSLYKVHLLAEKVHNNGEQAGEEGSDDSSPPS